MDCQQKSSHGLVETAVVAGAVAGVMAVLVLLTCRVVWQYHHSPKTEQPRLQSCLQNS